MGPCARSRPWAARFRTPPWRDMSRREVLNDDRPPSRQTAGKDLPTAAEDALRSATGGGACKATSLRALSSDPEAHAFSGRDDDGAAEVPSGRDRAEVGCPRRVVRSGHDQRVADALASALRGGGAEGVDSTAQISAVPPLRISGSESTDSEPESHFRDLIECPLSAPTDARGATSGLRAVLARQCQSRLACGGTRGGFAGRTLGYPQIRATRETGCARHGAEQPKSAWKSHAAAGAEGRALRSRKDGHCARLSCRAGRRTR